MKRIYSLLLLLVAFTAMGFAQDTWTVAGTAAALNGTADWAPENTANDMTSEDGVNYTLTVTGCTLEAGVDYQYKVVKNHAWSEAYPSSNKVFRVSNTAVYTVVYHFNASSYEVSEDYTKTGEAGAITHTYTVAGAPAEVFGEEWNSAYVENDMQKNSEGIYVWTATAKELAGGTIIKFKVAVDHSWGQAYPSNNFEKEIEEDGIYTITITFDEDTKGVTCTPQKTGDATIETVYVVAGSSEALFGTTWDGTDNANSMMKGTDGIWTKTYSNVNLPAGNIEWKVVKNGTKWIPDGEGNNQIIYVPEPDYYDVVFSFNESTQELNGQLLKDGNPVIVTPSTAEGWPAYYGGVMLQGFYWNSFEDSKLTELNKQVPTLSKYFDLVWLPNTGATGGEGMGYMPVYWLNHNSNFGRMNTLKKLIQNFNANGTKVIEDVVINHKAPQGVNESWVDFVNEKWEHDGITEEINWTPDDICQNDDGGYTNTMGADPAMIAKNGGWYCGGANDTGDDFSGGRDLDHTGANVQKNCKIYLNFLMKELGYSGFRLDMVKGYSGYYTKLYNEEVKPEFCVGEYWDGQDAITSWITSTGNTSAAFDFPFKYQIKEAFGNGNWSTLADYKGIAGDPNWQRYAVTFIDNHDTYENEGRLVNNVLGANAFMLAMPGTPCVFLKHWQRYPIAIGNMILARKACGITNQSSIVEQGSLDGGYYIKVQGSKGTVLCIAGYATVDTHGFKSIATGPNFAFFVSDNITVDGLVEGNDDEEAKDITIFVEAAEAPYLYSWNGSGQPTNGAWPGTKLTTTQEVGGKTFWTRNFTTIPVNIVINNGGDKTTDGEGEEVATGDNAVQSKNYENLTHDSYFTFDATNPDKATNSTDITSNYFTPEPVQLPTCAKVRDGELYCYFQGNKDYDSPYAWIWNDDKNFTGDTWPGVGLEHVGDDNGGHRIWLWKGGDLVDLFGTATPTADQLPKCVIFSNHGTPQTDTFHFENGGYYDATGLVGNVITTGIAPITVDGTPRTAVLYNLQGQRVSDSYRGIVIQNGKKVVNK